MGRNTGPATLGRVGLLSGFNRHRHHCHYILHIAIVIMLLIKIVMDSIGLYLDSRQLQQQDLLHLSQHIAAISMIMMMIIIIITTIITTTTTTIIIISFEPTGSALHLGHLEEGDGGVYRCQVDYSQVILMILIKQ